MAVRPLRMVEEPPKYRQIDQKGSLGPVVSMSRPRRGGRRAALVALGLALAGPPSTAWAADPGADTGLISLRKPLRHVCPAFTAAAGHPVPKRRGETVRGQKQNSLLLLSPPAPRGPPDTCVAIPRA